MKFTAFFFTNKQLFLKKVFSISNIIIIIIINKEISKNKKKEMEIKEEDSIKITTTIIDEYK